MQEFFTAILGLFVHYVTFLQSSLHLNPEMTLAFAHGSFNVANTAIQFPFIAVLAWVVTKLIPGEDVTIEYKPQHLDPVFIKQSSTVALSQAKAEIVRMGDYSVQGLEETSNFVITQQEKHADMAKQIEGALNSLDRAITNYLVSIASNTLSEADSAKHTAFMDSVRDFERIGDHFENIIELVEYKISNKINLTISMEDLQEMFDLTILTVQQAVKSLDNLDKEEALLVLKKEDQIDKMERKFRKKHIIRMNEGLCTGSAGIVFVDIISNLERIGDHAVNIAELVLDDTP